MGSFMSAPEEEKEVSLKLEAQRITSFSGSYNEWIVWKLRAECTFNGSGFDKILSSKDYDESNQKKSQIVYSQLSCVLVDGTAYHIVRKF